MLYNHSIFKKMRTDAATPRHFTLKFELSSTVKYSKVEYFYVIQCTSISLAFLFAVNK